MWPAGNQTRCKCRLHVAFLRLHTKESVKYLIKILETFITCRNDGSFGCVLCLVAQSCLTLCNSLNCSSPGSSVHGSLQARTLEWVAISFSTGSSQTSDQTCISCIAGRIFTHEAIREAQAFGYVGLNKIEYSFHFFLLLASLSENLKLLTWLAFLLLLDSAVPGHFDLPVLHTHTRAVPFFPTQHSFWHRIRVL